MITNFKIYSTKLNILVENKIFENSDSFTSVISHAGIPDYRIKKFTKLLEGFDIYWGDINKQDVFGYTALIYTCIDYGGTYHTINYETVKTLIKKDANLDLQDNDGRTALIWASVKNKCFPDNIEIIMELISAGADMGITDNKGRDFFNYLTSKVKTMFKKKYPEEYQNYLIQKDSNKYNL